MANTFELIYSATVGSGGASDITFSSIPATFTDLVVKISCKTNRSGSVDDMLLSFNGTTTGYSTRRLQGSGSSASSSSESSLAGIWYLGNGDSAFDSVDIYIPNYLSSGNKSVSIDSVTEANATSAYANFSAGVWSNSAAITSLKISSYNSSTITQYSTAYLYGVKNA
jgi:hypothetical protein